MSKHLRRASCKINTSCVSYVKSVCIFVCVCVCVWVCLYVCVCVCPGSLWLLPLLLMLGCRDSGRETKRKPSPSVGLPSFNAFMETCACVCLCVCLCVCKCLCACVRP